MVVSRSIQWLGLWLILVCLNGVLSKPLPQGTVTQSGEPSHFQVDDKAAEIEVNANPAGVKVNAKPASLQVVAKPGTPAIPVYHPAIHIAPHYLPPPIVHREPAMFYHHHHHCHPCCPPFCSGRSRGWFYSGLRRDDLPKPDKITHKSYSEDLMGDKSSRIPRPSDRDTLGRELDEDGNVINRSHKSSIPKPKEEHNPKSSDSHKRQFIAGIPQSYQPQGISSLGSLGYALQPYNSMLGARPPLARNIISGYGAAPMGLGSYGRNALSSLYGQPLSSNGLGALSRLGQTTSGSLGMYGGYSPMRSQFSPLSSGSPSYALGAQSGPKNSIINNFMQSELNHELYGSSATPSPMRFEQGYGRSMISDQYGQQPTGYGSLLQGRSLGGMRSLGIGSPYGSPYPAGLLGAYGNSAQGGLLGGYGNSAQGGLLGGYGNSAQGGLLGAYGNSALMQLARLYASQPLPSMIPGLQQYGQSRSAMPQLPYPYMGGSSSMAARSSVPGSKSSPKSSDTKSRESEIKKKTPIAPEKISTKNEKKSRKKRSNINSISTAAYKKNESNKDKKKSPNKRQLLGSDLGGYDLDALQDALENEVKREMILGTPQAPEPPPIAALTDSQSSLGLPLPGIEPVLNPNAQTANLMRLQQMAALEANYVSPIQRMNTGNLGNPFMRSQAVNSVALGRSQVAPDQLRMMPSAPEQMQAVPSRLETQAPLVRQLPQQQSFIQNRPNGFMENGNEFIGAPMRFNEEYKSPIQYDEERPRHYRRPQHPALFRRRLHHNYYDDDVDDYDYGYREERRPLYHERLGRERISMGGPYSEMPSNEGETLVDTNNHGFGPITVEAKTAEGLRKSIGEDKRGEISKPRRKMKAPIKNNNKKNKVPFKFGVL